MTVGQYSNVYMEQSKFARVGLVLINYRCIWPIIDQGSVQRSRSRTTQMIGSHPGCNWVIQAKPHWSRNVERRKYADHLLRPVSYFKRRRMWGNVRSWPSTPAEMPSVSLPSVLQLYGSPQFCAGHLNILNFYESPQVPCGWLFLPPLKAVWIQTLSSYQWQNCLPQYENVRLIKVNMGTTLPYWKGCNYPILKVVVSGSSEIENLILDKQLKNKLKSIARDILQLE